ncbi:M50 family metallopeptidase [Demequina pelophila]|uniref:M50 family metallopeptidase n=1 Tax=Demequina pelophila TaxID=1638984 RepID=UPI0007848009|nr:site-2 protease family protein [Demequina pelophila]
MNRPARSRGIPLGRVLGARVLLRPSTVLMAVLIAVLVGTTEQGLTRQSFTLGLAVAVGLFLAVFLHEVAHTAAARAFGREVDEIVLTFLGGHTQFQAKDPRPLEIGVIAAAGPVANALLGAGAWATANVLTGIPGMIAGAFGWLNLILAAFNALPGTPLDGGRVLNAIVWAVRGDRWAGHRAAAWGGRIIAIGVVVWAVGAPLLDGRRPDLITMLWSVLLFSVIWPAATQELKAASVLSRREDVTPLGPGVSAIGVPYQLSVQQAREAAQAAGAREVVVLAADGQPAGHFPVQLTDVVPEAERATTPLSAVTMPVVRGAEIPASLRGEEVVQALLPWLGKTDVLVITDRGAPVGIVMVEDLKRALT